MTIKELKKKGIKISISKDMKKEFKKFWKCNKEYSFRVWKKKHLYF